MSDARRTAVEALLKQERSGYANLVLNNVLRRFDGDGQQRAFVTAVFYGTVERMVTIDALLGQFLTRPLAQTDATVRAILRAGVYQARWMDGVPLHAAVNESVELARRMGKGSAAGLVNAVLRRAATADLAKMTFESETQRLSVLYSVTPALAAFLQAKLGERCEPFLAACFAQPTPCVRVNTLCAAPLDVERALVALGASVRHGFVPNSLYVENGRDLTATEPFAKGWFHVQGEASQLACAALAPRPGQKVVDVCAAPGGKSVTLAQYMQNSGTLLCRDRAANRVPLIQQALKRAGITCAKATPGDAAVYDPALENADAVLCDVPCSGLGILAKKPDIRQKAPDEFERLVTLQRSILETSSRYVKPNGRLVYSTCTINPDENEKVVQGFLAAHPEFTLLPLPMVPSGAFVQENMVTLYPQDTGLDGFFVALLTRNA
jgi:16S rRNA (cytosine967-C5)-methyltransferase